MALYEYQCENCGNRFERIHKFSDPPPETCPKCGQGPVRKLVSAPAFQFKGSGFYVTDYVKKSGVADSDTKSTSSSTKDSKSKDSASTTESAKDSSSKDTGAADAKAPAKDTTPSTPKSSDST